MKSLHKPLTQPSLVDDANNAIPISVGDRFFEQLEQQFGDFKRKRLISHYTFELDWDSWESHPAGEEFVCLLSGQLDFVLEQDGDEEVVSLTPPGQSFWFYAEYGIWQRFILPVQYYLLHLVKEPKVAHSAQPLSVDRSHNPSNH